jgi:hypothetical protein
MTITIITYLVYALAVLGLNRARYHVVGAIKVVRATYDAYRVWRLPEVADKLEYSKQVFERRVVKYERRLKFLNRIPIVRYFAERHYRKFIELAKLQADQMGKFLEYAKSRPAQTETSKNPSGFAPFSGLQVH